VDIDTTCGGLWQNALHHWVDNDTNRVDFGRQ
jgi:hypothetical protein